MCPLLQMSAGVEDSELDSCHSTAEDSSKLQQMVLLIWPSNAILKYQLANCCGGSMKIGDVFRARRSKHACLGIQSLNGHAKTVASKWSSQIPLEGVVESPSLQMKAIMEHTAPLVSCIGISSMPFPQRRTHAHGETHICVHTHVHMHTHTQSTDSYTYSC